MSSDRSRAAAPGSGRASRSAETTKGPDGEAGTSPLAVRVLLAEDHSLVRAGIRSLLASLTAIEIVGEARNGNEVLERVGELLPDVVIMDISMPESGGLDALVRIRIQYPSVRVIMLSMHDNEEYVWEALRGGAAGYLLKDSSLEELELAILSVAKGGYYLTPGVTRHVFADYLRRTGARPRSGDRLTARQREIVRHIAVGRSNREIAHLLGLSVKTIESHRAELMDRLGIHEVAGLVRYAVRSGLVEVEE